MRLHRSPALLACLLAGAWNTPSAAQATVTGVARDGQTGRPYAGATVELVSVATPWAPPLRAETDSAGRFTVVNVPPSGYLVGFMHPALEDVGLSQVTRRLDVSPAERRVAVDLSPPVGAELIALICGPDNAGRGALLGRVLAADSARHVQGGEVAVQWEQLNIAATGVSTGSVVRATPVLPSGRYILCDLPTDARILVRASGADSVGASIGTSGVVELEFGYASPLLHRDLLVGGAPASATGPSASTSTAGARLMGRVVTDAGRPVANAQVALADGGYSVRTDANGAFRLVGLPAGTRMIEAVAIGYVPVRVTVDLLPGREAVQPITMARGAVALDEVTVRVRGGKSDFERRREQGIGHFVTAGEIEKRGVQTVPLVLASIPSLRITGVDATGSPVITGRGGCTPAYYLDGQPILGAAVNFGTIRDIGGIEVYGSASEAPPQYAGPSRSMRFGPPPKPDSSSTPRNPFATPDPRMNLDEHGRDQGVTNDNAFCAVILIWTKAAVR